jgi:hypothetical protein
MRARLQFDSFLRKNDIGEACWLGITIIACGTVPVGVRPSIVPYSLGAAGKTLRWLNDGTEARVPSNCEKKDDVVLVLPVLLLPAPLMVEPMVVENCAAAGPASARSKITPQNVARVRTMHLPQFENAPIQPHDEAGK